MVRRQFYDDSENEICCSDAIGRVPLRIVGGVSLGLSLIQIILNSAVNSCSEVTTYLNIRNGAWWSGLVCFFTALLCMLSTNRGVIIGANILSIVSIAFALFALYYDRAGVGYLQNASTSQGYCEQLLAAGFVFDAVMVLCSVTLFSITCLSLLCPGYFNEQSYENILRKEKLKQQREARQRKQRWGEGGEEGDPGSDELDKGADNIHEEEDDAESKDYSEHAADVHTGSSRKVYMPSHNSDFDAAASSSEIEVTDMA